MKKNPFPNTNTLDLFSSWVNEPHIPPKFLRWGMLSCIAGCVGNKLFTRVDPDDDPLFLNLYLMLLGPSGCWKSTTMKRVRRILDKADWPGKINYVSGNITYVALLSSMRSFNQYPARGRVYLFHDELAACLSGPKSLADNFAKNMTGMYLGDPFDYWTMAHEQMHIPGGYTINWWANSTVDWAAKIFTLDHLRAGFWPRICIVEARNKDYITGRSFDQPKPSNHHLMEDELVQRLNFILSLEGEIQLTPDALTYYKDWSITHAPPTDLDASAKPHFQRQVTTLLKLSALVAVANRRCTIELDDVQMAAGFINDLSPVPVAEMKKRAYHERRPESEIAADLKQLIKTEGTMLHSRLLKVASNRGLTLLQFQQYLTMWLESQDIKAVINNGAGRPGTTYKWINKDGDDSDN